jgi:hypothetical protein
VIVTWGATPEAEAAAGQAGIDLWEFRHLLEEIAASRETKGGF